MLLQFPPPDQGWHDGKCDPPIFYPDKTVYVCCWTETEDGDPEKIEINKCQRCEVPLKGVVSCNPPFPDPASPPTTDENIVPDDEEVLEQPPKTDNQPIKSGDSVFPNDESKILDERQLNPKSPLTDQRFLPNEGVLEQSDDS